MIFIGILGRVLTDVRSDDQPMRAAEFLITPGQTQYPVPMGCEAGVLLKQPLATPRQCFHSNKPYVFNKISLT